MPGTAFHGMERPLVAEGAVRALRITHPANQTIDAHSHDWACLTLFVCGSYVEYLDSGERAIGGPAAVLYPPGSSHANRIGGLGLETVSAQIDPALLRKRGLLARCDRPHVWIGGQVGKAARQLARALALPRPGSVHGLLCTFLGKALAEPREARHPPWLDQARTLVAAGATTRGIAQTLDLHPAWLARRFLEATGESLQAVMRRHRVERALRLIRSSDMNLASVAAAADFCDQSHMNRSFRELLGRSPGEVRREARRPRRSAAA